MLIINMVSPTFMLALCSLGYLFDYTFWLLFWNGWCSAISYEPLLIKQIHTWLEVSWSSEFLAHLSHSDKVGFCDQCSSGVHPSVHPLLTIDLNDIPPKALVKFWNNFTQMILGWPSTKTVYQMVLVHCISRSQRLNIDFQDENFKNLLVRNQKAWNLDIFMKHHLVDLNQNCSNYNLRLKMAPPQGSNVLQRLI